MTNNSVSIETDSLTKNFGSLSAVRDLNLRVPTGECFSLLGPNGAGKTTTVRMLSGLLSPTSGTAKVCGFDVREDRNQSCNRVATRGSRIVLQAFGSGVS
ncbi:MAG: ATP-binding cassette domain-containing protein, partial [Candidatus Thorarchaeota archaeon]|nr:ATP-binding cassette domain-containing protein [Candidatus Thorarchaeota archaeon]